METSLQALGHAAVVELLGDTLDSSCADHLAGHIGGLAAEHRNVVLDMARVRFIDSAGCGALIAGLKQCLAAGGELRLCHLTPPVRTVLETARMTRMLAVYDTRQQALAGTEP